MNSDETKEQAQKRRAKQAEKRRLAAAKAAAAKAERPFTTSPTSSGAATKKRAPSKDDGSTSSSLKRARVVVRKGGRASNSNTPTSSPTSNRSVTKKASSAAKPATRKKKEEVCTEDEVDEEDAYDPLSAEPFQPKKATIHKKKEEVCTEDEAEEEEDKAEALQQLKEGLSKVVEEDEEPMEEEVVEQPVVKAAATKPTATKPTAKEKREATSSSSTATRPARKAQTAKHSLRKTTATSAKKKTTTTPAPARTPPRRNSLTFAANKPPFGSPPPAATRFKDPPSGGAAPSLPSSAQPTPAAARAAATAASAVPPRRAAAVPLPDPPSTTQIPLPRPEEEAPPAPVESPQSLPGDTAEQQQADTRTAASASASNTATSIAVPDVRKLAQMYEELDQHDDDDDEDYSGEDEDDEVNEELRRQALEVIAERRDRERIKQMQMQAARALQEQEEELEREQSRRAKCLSWPALFVLSTIFCFWFMGQSDVTLVDLVSPWFWLASFSGSAASNLHTCFLDGGDQGDVFGLELDPVCANAGASAGTGIQSFDYDGESSEVIQWLPCPDGATCQSGTLLFCPQLYEVVDNNACYLSLETNETAADIQKLLHTWTVQSECRLFGDDGTDANTMNREIGQWTGRPFFHYSRVVGELECGYDLHLLNLANESLAQAGRFVLEPDGDNVWVALHPDVPLKFSTTCRVGFLVVDVVSVLAIVVSFILETCWKLTQQAAWTYLGALLASPWYVGGATFALALLSLSLYRRWVQRMTRLLREERILQARTLVYEKLQTENGRDVSGDWHSSTWLCQDLAWRLHEMSSRGRKVFLTETWPYVAQDIAQDARILKSIRTEQGKRVEYWKWGHNSTNGGSSGARPQRH